MQAVDGPFQLADVVLKPVRDQPQRILADRELKLPGPATDQLMTGAGIRRLQPTDHPRQKPRDQLVTEAGEQSRVPVGGEHHLPPGRLQCAHCVQQLLLQALLAIEEVHIIHQQYIDAAKLLMEAGKRSLPQGLREGVGEVLGRQIQNLECRLRLADFPVDGFEQVGLA